MFEAVVSLIESHQRFLITGHVKPDGDCLGTESALYHLLVSMGKDVKVVNADGPEPALSFLEDHTPFQVHERGTSLPDHDVLCLCDCHSIQRTGSVGVELAKVDRAPCLVVDHHVGADDGDGDVLLWDVAACSAGSLVYDLFRQMGAPMISAAAEAVFTTIVSDTGWFRYSNTSDEAFAIAADLVSAGVEPHRVYQAIHHGKPTESVQLLGSALQFVSFEDGGRVAVCPLPKSFMSRMDRHDFNTDAILDVLRELKDIAIVALLKENRNGSVKISLRASDDVDVDGIAASFGGGGHRKAAGATLDGPLDRAREALLAKIREALRVP